MIVQRAFVAAFASTVTLALASAFASRFAAVIVLINDALGKIR